MPAQQCSSAYAEETIVGTAHRRNVSGRLTMTIAAKSEMTGSNAANAQRLDPSAAAIKASKSPAVHISTHPLNGKSGRTGKCPITWPTHTSTQNPKEQTRLRHPINFEIVLRLVIGSNSG